MHLSLSMMLGGGASRAEPPDPVNLVVNGDFATDLSGWVDASTAPGSVAWSSDGALMSRVTGSTGRLRQGVPTEIGKTYSLSVERVGGTVSGRLDVGTNAGGSQIEATIVVDGQISRTFVAISTTTWLNFYLTGDGTCLIDNVSLYHLGS